MIFEEKKIILRNGKEAIFKTPEHNDAERMLDYIKTCCGETEFLTRYHGNNTRKHRAGT